MAIVGNESTEIGDIIRIQTDVPIIGIVSLISFIDDIVNEDGTRYFDKYFRYSIDGGLNYTDWYELTTINISNIVVTRKDQFVIEYRYTRAGTEAGGNLAINSITLSGDFSELPYPVFRRNVFNIFFDVNDINVLGWALNVLEKLYNRGLLPDYIYRQIDELNPILADQDFTSLFNSITHFFAIFVYFARQFGDIYNNDILSKKFIDSLGLALNNNISDTHLKYLFDNYVNEFRKRGTNDIVKFGDNSIPNGELLRLINFLDFDEFIFALLEPSTTGWCISKSSPMFNSTTNSVNIVKGYEKDKGFYDLAKYPLVHPERISIVSGEMSITQDPALAENIGIHPDGVSSDIHKIIVDPSQAYEIVFEITAASTIQQLYFGAVPYDENDTALSMITLYDESSSNYFFEFKKVYRNTIKYLIRGIIFPYDFVKGSIPTDFFKLNFGTGYHLKFSDNQPKYIVPMLYVNTAGAPELTIIHNFKVRPLSFNFTQGILGVKSVLYLLYKNNSIFDEKYVYSFIKDKLVSYRNELIDNKIN